MTDPDPSALEPGAALCLSGGGYRAMLFHAGGLVRLNELGWLSQLRQIAGVSGGAILAGWLGLKWSELDFGGASPGGGASGGAAGGAVLAANLRELVVEPLFELAGRPLDIAVGLAGMLTADSVLARGLDRQLFHGALAEQLPDGAGGLPRVTLYATNLLTGGYTEFSAHGVEEEHLGQHDTPGLRLAAAVAASCSIPPTFRPFRLRLDPARWRGDSSPYFARVRQSTVPLRLCDGGNHDNLALKAVWDTYHTLLVSDGSSPMPPWRWISGDWLATTLRSNRILIDQIRSLKKRILIKNKLSGGNGQQGAYWGIASSADSYGLADALVRDSEATLRLATMRTRLGRHTYSERARLVNFGYAMADTAVRRHLPSAQYRPGAWPFPEFAL